MKIITKPQLDRVCGLAAQCAEAQRIVAELRILATHVLSRVEKELKAYGIELQDFDERIDSIPETNAVSIAQRVIQFQKALNFAKQGIVELSDGSPDRPYYRVEEDGEHIVPQGFVIMGQRKIPFKSFSDRQMRIHEAKQDLRKTLDAYLTFMWPVLKWRTEPEIDTETDFETDTLVVKLYARGVFDKSVKASEMTSWLIELP